MMKKEIKYWFFGIISLFLISIIITISGYPFLSSLKAVFGTVYVLFLPGYVLVRLFFNKIDWIEILALSLGLSIALVILSVLITNMIFRIPITSLSNFLVLLGVIIITVLIKVYQKQLIKLFSFKK